jgi:MoaA/NifB/PqqE/SkfB family radical SAM enzyme
VDHKKYVTDPTFCPVPWTGFMYNFDGSVKNCIRSAEKLGNITDTPIRELLNNNNLTRQCHLEGRQTSTCEPCYTLEGGKQDLNIISDRKFYIKALRQVPMSHYDQHTNFDLHTIDIRWSNLCNFACIYCEPQFSSRWAGELKVNIETPSPEQRQDLRDYVFEKAHQLKHVYMAGGEPLLMRENRELLEHLREVNPGVQLRINTNLSRVDTEIFNLVCSFDNVHWTISAETLEAEYEYIRWGASWEDFLKNLETVYNLSQQKNHKINFNMLHFFLNPLSLFQTVDYFKRLGFVDQNFIVGALLGPYHLNIRNLPETVLQSVDQEITARLKNAVSFWADSLVNLQRYIHQPWEKKLDESYWYLSDLDRRRGCNFRVTFKDLIERIEKEK